MLSKFMWYKICTTYRCMRTFWQENGNIDSFLLWNGNVRATSSLSYFEWYVCRIKCDQPEIHFCCEDFFRLFFHLLYPYSLNRTSINNVNLRILPSVIDFLFIKLRFSLQVEWILNRWKKRNESNQFNLLLRAELHESQTTAPFFSYIHKYI